MLHTTYILSSSAAAWSVLLLGQTAAQHVPSALTPEAASVMSLLQHGPIGLLSIALLVAIRWFAVRDAEKEARIEELHKQYKEKLDAMNTRELESFSRLAEASNLANRELSKVSAELAAARAEVDAWKARAELSDKRLSELELEVKRLHDEARSTNR